MIDVLVPVLGRPHNAAPLAQSLAASTTVPYRLVWITSPGDHAQAEACRAAGGTVVVTGWEPGRGDFARKINLAFELTAGRFIFQAADDVEFTPCWDVNALAVADRTGAGVVGTNDDGNPTVKRGDHSTHSLILREYVDRLGGSMDGPGVVFHEGYGHQGVDTELVELAKARGQWAFAAASVVRHRHPFWDRSVQMDGTYRKGQATSREDAKLYRQRSKAWARLRHVA